METFLGNVSSHIIRNHQEHPENLAVILPSRRAVTYLKRELIQQVESPMPMPHVYSIEDFIFEASGFEAIDNTSLMLELFHVHREIKQENATSLETFLSWAPVMIQDFNTLDENLADAPALFTFLSEAKAIEKWRPGESELSSNEKDYIQFFQLLKTYYQKLRLRLLQQKKAYPGMAIRAIWESNILHEHEQWKHFIFAGFYALTKAEESIIESLNHESRLTLLYDADKYYIDNSYHEAGRFLRDKVKSPNFRWLFDHYQTDNKNINITGVSGNVGQSRKAGQLISEIHKGNHNLEDTAVILADESLLLPLLNSLPTEVEALNVTMGFPIIHTSTANLLRLLLKIAADRERYERDTFHVNDFLQVLSSPLLKALIGDNDKLKQELLKQNRVLYQLDEIQVDLPDHLFSALKPSSTPVELLDHLITMMRSIPESETLEKNMPIERYSAIFVSDRLMELRKAIENQHLIQTFKDLEKLIRKTILNGSLPFSGEPMKGLQVMGMLESRALDFENIIVLSVNEGNLPAAKNYSSLIPFDIRKKFGLPTYRDNDSIYAYHFYRLLQRPESIELIYNTEANRIGGNDQSRFIKQMKYELPRYNNNIKKIPEYIQKPSFVKPEQREITIPKTGAVMNKLAERLQAGKYTGLSASGLKTLTACSLQYYFRYILGLKKPDEVEETIPMNIFGDTVHKILEDIYAPTDNKPFVIREETLNINKNHLDEKVTEFLRKKYFYSQRELEFGRNRLMREMAVRFVMKFLKKEKEQIKDRPVEIIEVEKPLSYTMQVNGYEVHLRGFADRIDKFNGNTRVMDYKTGNLSDSALSQPQSIEQIEDLKTGEIVQVLFYDWVYSMMTGDQKEKQGGIFLLTKPLKHSIFFKYEKHTGITENIRKKFEEMLLKKLQELLDPATPFIQTEDKKRCENCDFKHICNRQ